MKSWFTRRSATTAPSSAEAYREGRIDESRAENGGPWAGAPRPTVVVRRRRGFGGFGLLALLIIVFGGLMLYLAARNGSFSAGGAVIDNNLSQATHTVTAPVRNAADKTGQALQNAGSSLRQQGGK